MSIHPYNPFKIQSKRQGKKYLRKPISIPPKHTQHTHEHTYAIKLKHETQHEKNEVKYSNLQNWVMANEQI